MLVIGLAGKKRVGKDTIAAMIEEQLQFSKVQSIAFADPIKDALTEALGIPRFWFDSEDFKERPLPYYGITPRQAMQTFGTGWGREMVDDQIWVKRAKLRLEAVEESGVDIAILTDVRFENEAELVRNLGGVVCHVTRGTGQNDAHESEQGLSPKFLEYELDNNGSVEDLYAGVKDFLQHINIGRAAQC